MFMDDDIKIFHKQDFVKEPKDDLFDVPFGSEQLSDKALQLGCQLAQLLSDNEEKYDAAYFNASVQGQAKLLLAFTICNTLSRDCQSATLANTALNSFYSTLKSINPHYYEDFCSSGSLSFYYLAARQTRDVERRMGQTFAMLCAEDGNGIYQELGEALYCKYRNLVQVQIQQFELGTTP